MTNVEFVRNEGILKWVGILNLFSSQRKMGRKIFNLALVWEKFASIFMITLSIKILMKDLAALASIAVFIISHLLDMPLI